MQKNFDKGTGIKAPKSDTVVKEKMLNK